MFVCVRPVILLLLLNFLDLSSSSSSNSGEDYSVLEDTTTEPPISSSTTSEDTELNYCDYNMCVEHQQTCVELAEDTGCLCPGLERLLPPGSPTLSSLTQHDDKGVVVHWCAPTSIVSYYKVSVKDEDRVQDILIEEKKRTTVLLDVAAGALVCVAAVNKNGVSEVSKHSCATFKPQQSPHLNDSGLALKLGIIGGVVGLIVLLILALLWIYKRRRGSSAGTETWGVL